MSSSVFIESGPKPVKGGIGLENEVAISGSPDSNLVVVYGKSGVNFDQRGIENLIEEKTLSSISVIRLTSPTPSMIDEEQEAEKTEELLRRQADGLSDDESNESNNRNNSSADECAERSESEELATTDDEKSNGENSVGNGKPESRKPKRKNKRKSRTSGKLQSTQNKLQKERPDIIGLTIEEFYPPVTAKEVVKEALKLAGVSTIKHTADYEFQLFVIKNDHCYTPFTSPAQMKAKLAEKYKAEKHAIIGRKIIPHSGISMKQIQIKKKFIQNINDCVDPPAMKFGKDQPLKALNKNSEASNKSDVDDLIEEDVDVHSSAAESDLDIISEESGDTDNDRDSDLDFDVNNRKGRKKKDLVTKAKRLSAGKVYVKRHIQTHDDIEEYRNKNIRPVVSTIINRSNKVAVPSTVTSCAPIAIKKLLSDAVAALPPIPKRPPTAIVEEKPLNSLSRQTPIPSAIRRGPIIEVGVQKTPIRSQMQSSPQSVKEIAINKVMASPKGGFTEIGELLSQAEKRPPIKAVPTTPTSSIKPPGTQMVASPSSTRGFMPLGVETATKIKLPAQISIQTHQSSSELAAKNKASVELQQPTQLHDIPTNNSGMQCIQKDQSSSELAAEQFDLIVSIVKDEMQKTELMKDISKPNDNIPKLVKMLENAEQTLESNNTQSQMEENLPTFSSSADRTVDDIDISNAPLLDAPEGDEIPDDLLQHVVDLIEDDETLQEAVENQVFGGDNRETVLCARTADIGRAMMSSTTTRPIVSSVAQQHTSETEPNQPKSIIEMAISNIPSTPIREISSSNSVPIRVTNVQAPKGTPLFRKEPIQIVRGNGRVIILPPIEAPTTRAKRRAQNQPITGVQSASANSSAILNDSSMDSSVQSNSSFNVLEPVHTFPVVVENKKESNKRRVSKETAVAGGTTKAKRSTAKKNTTAKNITSKTVVEEDASCSQEDDDDPNKLWCICRQPHNNRFMICCDVCEDWFHGTCVNITKAMGIEMEQKGIDWTCPKCVKLQEEKKQRKITDMLIPKKAASNNYTDKNEKLEFETRDIATTVAIGSITDSLTNINSLQKSDGLDIQQTAETNKYQYEEITPIKPPLKKQIGATKTASSSQKKKAQSSNAKHKSASVGTIQTKRRIPVSEQEPNIQVESANPTTLIKSIPGSQQTFKDLRNSPEPESKPTDEHTTCIVCKKVARPNSIYCSDDCIRKHAQNALNVFAAASAAKPPEPNIVVCVNEEAAVKKKKSKGLFEDILSMADRKPKVERVNVIERKTGRVLTGSNAPTTLNLKKWLQDNQTFEVVQPGSFQAQEIEKKQKQRHPQSLSPVVISSSGKHITQANQNTQNTFQSLHGTPASKPATQSQREYESSLQLQKPVKQLVEQIVKTTSNSPRPGTPKQLQKYPQQVTIRPDKVTRTDSKEEAKEKKEKPSKQRSSIEGAAKKPSESGTAANSSSEPIRLNVRRTFKEQLLQRMNELCSESGNLPKLSIEEIEKFALETEAEMYEYFSRDTGSRYRAKYRSLMFNIKDRKNHTLFAKICAKIIQPKQLVRMSPEELASQELAKWRENETKHQLEMIKKSELDLLSCTKNYVLKTHKGEEVIEGKQENCVNLDVTIPVEDVVSVLNSSVVSSSSAVDDKVKDDLGSSSLFLDHPQKIENAEIQSTKITNRSEEEKQKSYPKEKDRETEQDCERDRNRDHGRDREHSHTRARSHDSDRSREKQKKSRDKDRQRDKSRSRKRSRSHSRSRSRSREKRHKSHYKDEKREKEERDREKDKYKEKDRDRERDSRSLKDEFDKRTVEKSLPESSNLALNPNKNSTNISGKDKNNLKKTIPTKPIEAYSLIDQILESTKTVEEAANLISEKEKIREKDREKEKQKKDTSRQAITPPLPTSSITKFTSEQNRSFPNLSSNEDQEPTSTVSIATPPQDPYIRYSDVDSPTLGGNLSSVSIWSGNINMVDVASFQIVLQPVVGNSLNMGALLPDELDVVGRIGPDTVWEYISKIKRSPNKEIVIIRLIPASESETAAYTVLFQYLEYRNRLGVISTVSPQMKDFYIYPLAAGKPMPPVLLPTEKVDFYEDPYRPDILVGVVVRIIGKRHSTAAAISSSSIPKSYRRGTDPDTFTPPGSPKRKRRIHASTPKVDHIDLDAIIKAPITTKSHKAPTVPLTTTNDADEPYSPGGSSDDDTLLIPKTTGRSDEDELKRKMDELNRQIAAQEKEIAGLLNVESSCFATTSSSKTSAVLANISIPSNLSQILASIKNKPEGNQTQNSTISVKSHQTVVHTVTNTLSNIIGDVEYTPEMALIPTSAEPKGKASSRLAQLSEAELLSMVPDGMMDTPPVQKCTEIKPHFEEPPPPGV